MLTERLLFALFVLLCCALAAPVPSENDDDDCPLKYCDLFSDVCKNGAKCISTNCKNGICHCPDGFGGHFCEIVLNKPKTTTEAPRYTRKRKTKRKKKINSLILRLFKTLAYSRSAPEQEKEDTTDPPTTPKTTTTRRTTTTTRRTTPTTTTRRTTTTTRRTTPTTTTRRTTPTTTTIPTTTTSTTTLPTTTTTTTTTSTSTTTVVHVKSIKEHLRTTNVPTTTYFVNTIPARSTTNIPAKVNFIPAPISVDSKVTETEEYSASKRTTISADLREESDTESTTPPLVTMYASVKPNIDREDSASTTPMPNLEVEQDIEDLKPSSKIKTHVDTVSNKLDLSMKKNNEKLDNAMSSGVSKRTNEEQTQGRSSDLKEMKITSIENVSPSTTDTSKSLMTKSSAKPVLDKVQLTNEFLKDITDDSSKEVSRILPSKRKKKTSLKLEGGNKPSVPGVVPLKTLQDQPKTTTEKMVEKIPDSHPSHIEPVTSSTFATSTAILDGMKNTPVLKEVTFEQDNSSGKENSMNSSKDLNVPAQSLPNKTLSYLKSFTQQFLKTVMSEFDSPSQNGSSGDGPLTNETSQGDTSFSNVSYAFDETANATDTSNMTIILPDDLDAGNSTLSGENYVILDSENMTDSKMASSHTTTATSILQTSTETVSSATSIPRSDADEKTTRGGVLTTRAPRVHIIEPAHLRIKTDKNTKDRMSISARISGFENSILADSDTKNSEIGVEKHIHNLYLDKDKELSMNEETQLYDKLTTSTLNTTPSKIKDNPVISKSTSALLTSTTATFSAPLTEATEKTLSKIQKDNDVLTLQKLSAVSTTLPQEEGTIPSESSLYVDNNNSFS